MPAFQTEVEHSSFSLSRGHGHQWKPSSPSISWSTVQYKKVNKNKKKKAKKKNEIQRIKKKNKLDKGKKKE